MFPLKFKTWNYFPRTTEYGVMIVLDKNRQVELSYKPEAFFSNIVRSLLFLIPRMFWQRQFQEEINFESFFGTPQTSDFTMEQT